jgi:hypothetical protein
VFTEQSMRRARGAAHPYKEHLKMRFLTNMVEVLVLSASSALLGAGCLTQAAASGDVNDQGDVAGDDSAADEKTGMSEEALCGLGGCGGLGLGVPYGGYAGYPGLGGCLGVGCGLGGIGLGGIGVGSPYAGYPGYGGLGYLGLGYVSPGGCLGAGCGGAVPGGCLGAGCGGVGVPGQGYAGGGCVGVGCVP